MIGIFLLIKEMKTTVLEKVKDVLDDVEGILEGKYDNVDVSILEAFLCEVDSYLLLLGLDEEIFEEEEYGE